MRGEEWVAAIFARQKSAPVFGGGQVALVLSCCESLLAARRPGSRRGGKEPQGGGCAALLTAAPHPSWTPHHGGMQNPGPPNCFPSTAHGRCWPSPGPACLRCHRPEFPSGRCPVPQSACGRRESDVR